MDFLLGKYGLIFTEFDISRYSYLLETLISSEYDMTISGHVTVLRKWPLEKNTDYIITHIRSCAVKLLYVLLPCKQFLKACPRLIISEVKLRKTPEIRHNLTQLIDVQFYFGPDSFMVQSLFAAGNEKIANAASCFTGWGLILWVIQFVTVVIKSGEYYVRRKVEMHENRRIFSAGTEFAKNGYAYVLIAPSRSLRLVCFFFGCHCLRWTPLNRSR